MQPCSETWEMGIALVWILKVNFYKLRCLGSDHTVLLPFFPARLGWIDSLSPEPQYSFRKSLSFQSLDSCGVTFSKQPFRDRVSGLQPRYLSSTLSLNWGFSPIPVGKGFKALPRVFNINTYPKPLIFGTHSTVIHLLKQVSLCN